MALEDQLQRIADLMAARNEIQEEGLFALNEISGQFRQTSTSLQSVERLLRKQLTPKEQIIMALQTTDDFKVSYRAEGFDADGVSTGLITGGTATVDRPDVASVSEDPNSPGSYIVERLPASDTNSGNQTVTLTVTDLAGNSVSAIVDFAPGKENSIVLTPTLVALSNNMPVVSTAPPAPTSDTPVAPGDTVMAPAAPAETVTDPEAPVQTTPTDSATPSDLTGGPATSAQDSDPAATPDPGTVPAAPPADAGATVTAGDTSIPGDPTTGDQGSGTSPTQTVGGGPADTTPGSNPSTAGQPTPEDPTAPTIPSEPEGSPAAEPVPPGSNPAMSSG